MGARYLHHPLEGGRGESLSGEERMFAGGRILRCSLYRWRWDCVWFVAGAGFEGRENWGKWWRLALDKGFGSGC